MKNFDQALADLRAAVLMIGGLTERNLQNATGCILNRDLQLCAAAIADKEEICALQQTVEDDSAKVLLDFEPATPGIQAVISAMKVTGNLGRIANRIAKIARRGRKLSLDCPLNEARLLEPILVEVTRLLKANIRVYSTSDAQMAQSLRSDDPKLDELSRAVAHQITSLMEEKPEQIPDYVNLLRIARHLQRIGNHLKKIAEDTLCTDETLDIPTSG